MGRVFSKRMCRYEVRISSEGRWEHRGGRLRKRRNVYVVRDSRGWAPVAIAIGTSLVLGRYGGILFRLEKQV